MDCFTIKKAKKMKKLVFLFATVVAVSFTSCGNKAAQNEACDSNEKVCTEEVACEKCACGNDGQCDSTCTDSKCCKNCPAAE